MQSKGRNFVRLAAVMACAMLASCLAYARPGDAAQTRLCRRGVGGSIAVHGQKFPGNAGVSFSRTRSDSAKRSIVEGLSRRRKAVAEHSRGGRKMLKAMKAAAPAAAAKSPNVLAMYDISINAGGQKWQPAAGEPVRVDIELDEPVTVAAGTVPAVVHLADDGTVEELDASRYGFTYNKERSAVTAFWFSANGFSVYAITEGETHKTDSTPARRLYDFYSLDFDTTSGTYNTYIPRYFTTVEGNRTFRQIVTNNQYLVRPEALPSPLGRTFMGWYLYSTNNANMTVDGVTYDADGYATTPFDFEDPVVFNEGETGETEYVLRSQFDRVGYVVFHEQPSAGVWPITAVRRSIMSEEVVGGVTNMRATVEIGDIKVTYDDSEDENSTHENTTPRMIFRGWSEVKVMPGASTNVNGGPIVIQSNPYTFTRRKDTLATPRHLFPVFVNINWLTFKAAATGEGATYIPPRYYYADEGTNSFPVPARTGYTFNGWWTTSNDVAGVTGVRVSKNDGSLNTSANLSGWDGYIKNGNLMLNANTTLYGRWEAAPTRYTVVIWQQSATDAANLDVTNRTYDFVESYTNTALSASTVSVAQKYKDYSYENFHYDRCDDAKVIDGNGSTVLNVYYDRNVHTLRFFTGNENVEVNFRYNNSNYSTTLSSAVGDSSYVSTLESRKRTINGYEVSYYSRGWIYSTDYYCIKIGDTWYQVSSNGERMYNASSLTVDIPGLVAFVTALAGSSVKDVFPIEGYVGKTWKGDAYYTERLASFELVPDTDIDFTLATGQNKHGVLYYYVEVGSQDEMGTDGVTWNGKRYRLYKTIEHDYNFLTKKEDFQDLDGYTQAGTDATWNSDGKTSSLSDNNVHRFYYDRNSQTIEFKDSYSQSLIKEVSVKYSESIAGHVPAEHGSSRPGYSFTGWYTDSACSTRVFFEDNDEYRNYRYGKVLYATMPSHNLQIYAGWETEWYLIQIDPNGGELAAGQSTWFWEAYQGDPIEEYSTVTRSFEENVNGTYFYAVRDRKHYGYTDEWVSGENGDRRVYYTTDQSDDAIVDIDKRYSPVVNAFRYAGWYEVMPDGSEQLYAFGEPVQRNTLLRLHWKHLGKYRLHYDPGIGQMTDRDENEETFKLLDDGIYADGSELLITRTAEPPDGYYFSGWRIRFGDDTVYHPGQTFHFNSAYSVTVPDANGRPVKQLVLDAVYHQVRTVSLTTDANGGTIDPTIATTLPLAYPNAPTLITNITDTTRTVSGMRNNAYGNLSDGKGYTCIVQDAEGNDVELGFLGWNTKADGTGTHFDPGQYVGVDTLDAPNGHNVLYAEWAVPVYFDKNNEDVEWPHDVWKAKWGDKYVFVTNGVHANTYCQITTLNGYATYPNIVRDSSTEQKMFAFWSTERYKDDSLLTPFDFENTPITGPTVLYAIWTDFIEVPFHPVDASGETPVVREDWYKTTDGVASHVIRVGNETNVIFDDDHVNYVTPTDCIYAYACLADGVEHISEKTRISRLYYDLSTLTTYVGYPSGDVAPLPSGKEIYFVYFTGDRQVDIGYRVMGQSGVFEAKTPANNGPTSETIGTDAVSMASFVTAPNTYVPGHDHYAFAIGETNATSAAQLRIITPAKERDNDRPQLQIRNSWRGFEYSLDGGTTWSHYGHNAQLYVLYFDSTPTIVNLSERTIGTEGDVTNNFEYVVAVTQVVTTVTNYQVRTLQTSNTSDSYYNRGWRDYPEHYTYQYSSTKSYTYYYGANDIYWSDWRDSGRGADESAEEISVVTNSLANGGTETITLFSSIANPGGWMDAGTTATSTATKSKAGTLTLTQTQVKIITTNMQFVVITQRPVGGFATSNDTGDGEYVYTQTSAATNATCNVTYTNTRESLPVELHVAFAQSGAIDHVDNTWRTETEADYTLTVPLSVEGDFEDALEKTNVILRAAAADRRFLGAYYGTAVETDLADENKVSLVGPVTSVGFVKKPDADWYRICLNGDANLALGDYKIYYVYGEIPSIRYMKEGANGALTEIPTLTYVGNAVKMNGYEVSQGEALNVPMDGTALTVGAGGTANFYVPLSLDGSAQASLNYFALAAGPAGMASTNAMDGVTWGTSIRLKVAGGLLKWSVDGQTWSDFSGAAASIYAIYKERGYDLTIAVNSLASAADRAVNPFTVTVASRNLLVGTDYVVSGYAPGGTPVDYVTATACDVGGMLTFTVTGGVRFTIQSLPNNEWPDADSPMGRTVKDYVLRELTPSSDYVLTNLLINGAVPLGQMQIANGVATFMDMNKTVEFTNIKRYDVTFRDVDGAELKAATPYWYGTKAAELAVPADPARAMDASGIYRFANWSPALEDVGSNTVYTAVYNAYSIPHATQRAADTNIVVTLPDEQTLINTLKSQGIDVFADDYSEEAATAKLNARDPNGLRRWENLVTGTATNQLVLGTAATSSDSGVSFGLSYEPTDVVGLGYSVSYELRKWNGSGWSRLPGVSGSDDPAFSVESDDVNGYYRVFTLIVPNTDLSITNEIPSTNTIGVLRIASTAKHTMAAVPFLDLPKDPALKAPVKVEGYVGNGFVKDGDFIRTREDGTFKVWAMEKSGKFEPYTSVKASGKTVEIPGAAESPLVPGRSVWVSRADHSKPFIVLGQFSGDPIEVEIGASSTDAETGKTIVGATMVTNPNMEAVKINDIDWGANPLEGDSIEIPAAADGSLSTRLFWYPSKGLWGQVAMVWNGKRYSKTLVSDFAVPAGQGFWYYRASGGAFRVTVKRAQRLD